MRKLLATLLLLLPAVAQADAPVIWSGSYVKWLASGLQVAGLMKTDAAGKMTPYVTDGLIKMSSGVPGAASSGTDYAPATSGSAILKGNGSGGFSSASSGTDYAPATSGTAYLKGNGSGGFTNQSTPIPVTDGGSGTNTAFTQNSVVFAGASGVYSQDNSNFAYNDTTGLLTVKNGNGASTTGIKIYSGSETQIQIEDTASTTHWTVGAASGIFYLEKSGFPWLSHTSTGTQMFGSSGAPKWTFNNLVADTSTSVADIIPGGAIHDISVITSQNSDTTANNYSGFITSGGAAGSSSTTSADTAILGVHEVHTSGSETGHLEFYVENAGAGLAKALNLAKDKTVTMPAYGAGIAAFSSAGVVSSTATTGSGSVVLATSPTMTNPVVGTQSVGDNSTLAASTAFVTTALNQLNPAAAVKAASTTNIPGTYTNAASGVCIGDTFRVTSTAAFAPDGVTLTVGQRFLMKDQSSGFQNGVWTLTTAANVGVLGALLTRALDWDSLDSMNAGNLIPVISGTANANTVWFQTATVTTCNSDPQVYTQFSGASSTDPAAVLTKTTDFTILTSSFSTTTKRLLLEVNCTSACTMTLPAASNSGFEAKIINVGTATATISTAGSDTFGSTTDTTWTLLPGGDPQSSNSFISNGGTRWDGF